MSLKVWQCLTMAAFRLSLRSPDFSSSTLTVGLEGFADVEVENINPQVDRRVFHYGHSVLMLASGRPHIGCAIGHLSVATSCSFINQAPAQLNLFRPERLSSHVCKTTLSEFSLAAL